MALANYGELKTAVRSHFADRSDIPDDVYKLATAELNQRLNLRIMQATTTLAFANGDESKALPSDFLRPVHAYVDRDVRVVLDLADEFAKNVDYRKSGLPRTYTIANGSLFLNPVPDGDYNIVLRYVAKLADFSANSDTNAVLTAHPALYLYAALKRAAVWAQDNEMAGFYAAALDREIADVERLDAASRFGDGPIRVRAAHTP